MELGREMYRWMVLTRTLDDLVVKTWSQGKGVGGYFSQRGHEGISVGVGLALGPGDIVAPLHRDLGTYLVRGMSPERILGNLLGRITGPSRGRDANLHGMGDLTLGIIGFISHIPHSMPTALGAAMAFRYRNEERVALTFVGDGGTAAGAFHETLNMAALWNAPFVLVIENNQYAYSTPFREHSSSADFGAKVRSYGVRFESIDGNDVELVYQTVSAAIDSARRSEGPFVIEARTMRMRGHAIHDGAEYVPDALISEWSERDPIDAFRRRLLERDPDIGPWVEAVDMECRIEAERAMNLAQSADLPDPIDLLRGVYHE